MSGPNPTGITRADIETVVAAFYQRTRVHPVLGPVFKEHVKEWPTHESKIARFWASAILHERSYSGNPMQRHLEAGNVHVEHFAIWLTLFDTVLAEQLAAPKASHWSNLAHRIGTSLTYGLVYAANKVAAQPPQL